MSLIPQTRLLNILIRIGRDIKTVNDKWVDILLSFLVDQCLTNLNNKQQLLSLQLGKIIGQSWKLEKKHCGQVDFWPFEDSDCQTSKST